jgi:NADH dehydrogenase (ubiquinone) 1 alpha subcomplex subunit 8
MPIGLARAIEPGQWLTQPHHSFNQQVLYDTTPLPDSIPKVKEIGSSSAPLLSASFFIGARCKDYNDDYMQCKTENPGRGEFDCMKEGRRVTRCARSVYVPSALESRD